MGLRTFYQIVVIVVGVLLCLLSLPYWIYIKYAIASSDVTNLALYIITAVFLLVIGGFVIYSAIQSKAEWLLILAIILICVFIIAFVQLIITSVTYTECTGAGTSGFFSSICYSTLASFYVPVVILLVVTLGGGIMCLLLRKKIKDEEEGGGGPKGSYYAQ